MSIKWILVYALLLNVMLFIWFGAAYFKSNTESVKKIISQNEKITLVDQSLFAPILLMTEVDDKLLVKN